MAHNQKRCSQLLTASRVATVSLLSVLAGCEREAKLPTTPSIGASRSVSVTGSRDRRPDEDRFVALAQEEPSLAGFFVDGNRLIANVADTAAFGRAEGSPRRSRIRPARHAGSCSSTRSA